MAGSAGPASGECSACGEPGQAGNSFCEACGTELAQLYIGQAELAEVVDAVDAATGPIRLKKNVGDADEMAHDTRSTKTVRTWK